MKVFKETLEDHPPPEYCWRVSIAELDVLQKLVFYLISAPVQIYYFSLVPLCRIWSSMPYHAAQLTSSTAPLPKIQKSAFPVPVPVTVDMPWEVLGRGKLDASP